MKKYLILMLLGLSVLTSYSLTAQSKAEDTKPKDPKAKAILDKMTTKTKAYNTIKADFEYALVNKSAGINETQKGKIWIKGDMYKIDLKNMQRLSDGKTVWTYLSDADELQISDAPKDNDSNEEMIKPSAIFTLYQKGFNYKYENQISQDNRTLDVIKLFPEKTNRNFHTIKLYIDVKTNEPYLFQVFSKDGNQYTYKIFNIKANEEILNTLFKFDETKAGDVIDLRD
jgi:outer membrane lipoprotein-sorting protein